MPENLTDGLVNTSSSVRRQIFLRTDIWTIWILRSTAQLKFVGVIYFNDMEKIEKFQ